MYTTQELIDHVKKTYPYRVMGLRFGSMGVEIGIVNAANLTEAKIFARSLPDAKKLGTRASKYQAIQVSRIMPDKE